MNGDMNGIEEYENAYSKEYCERVIEVFETCHSRNITYFQNDITKNSDDRIMYDWSVHNQMHHQDPILVNHFYEVLNYYYKEQYLPKYNILKTLHQHTAKGMGIQRTSPHQGYHAWHTEVGNAATGCRVIAYTLYLNDVDKGGETEFLYQGVKVAPKQGKLSLFPTGYTHPHRGNPIYEGYKYIITGWFTFDH